LESLKVGWLASRNPMLGGEYLRAVRPAALVNRKYNWHTAVSRELGCEGKYRSPLMLVQPNAPVFAPDLLIIRPIGNFLPDYIEQGKRAGQVMLADLDDDVWGHELAVEMGGKGFGNDRYDDWFPVTHGVVASTETLGDICRQHHPGPVFVLPNCYDSFGPSQLGPAPRPGRRVGTRLFLKGRQQIDLDMYTDLVLPLLDELDLTFVHLGAYEGSDFPTLRGWDTPRLEEHPIMEAHRMAEVLGTISIGIICVGKHRYNDAKTLTHPAELAAVGLPMIIATPTDHYKGVPGVVEPTVEAVRARIVALQNPRYWEAESLRARHWVMKLAAKAEREYLSGILEIAKHFDLVKSPLRITGEKDENERIRDYLLSGGG
jgi:hypothetical protein